jgi:hypothetical protein
VHIIVRCCMKSCSQWFEISGNDGHHTVFCWWIAIHVPILLPTLFEHSSNYTLRSSNIHHTTLTLLHFTLLQLFCLCDNHVFGPFNEAIILQRSGAERCSAHVLMPSQKHSFWRHIKACASWTKCSKVGSLH